MYLRLKFTAGFKHFDTVFSSKPISQWIREVLSGVTAVSALPSAAFELANCVLLGSLPAGITVQSFTGGSVGTQSSIDNNYIQFTKQHSQNANFINLFRIYQQSSFNLSFQPRILSSNATNIRPTSPTTSTWWTNGVSTTYMTHGLSSVEFQFFISQHWVIWSTLDVVGRGGTAGIYDVESTGQDVWARTLNSLYSPQIFISAHGQLWPSASTTRVSEGEIQRNQVVIGSNLMYNGDNGFVTRGFGATHGVYSSVRGNVVPQLYPDPNVSFFSTRDNIGDTQNFMVPVYFHTTSQQSTTVPGGRATLNGRVPFLWRTTDNAAQTGQSATVGGVEYRFVRLHGCGTAVTADTNAATYMVPTLIGGI